MEKPDKWYSNKKERKLSPEAKSYLSFKLKEYWHNKRTGKLEIIEEQREEPKPDEKVRIWLKWNYPDEVKGKGLYVEAYIEGYFKDWDKLCELLLKAIEDGFDTDKGEVIEDRYKVRNQMDMGGEWKHKKIHNFGNNFGVGRRLEQETPFIRYRNTEKGKWKTLR